MVSEKYEKYVADNLDGFAKESGSLRNQRVGKEGRD